MGRKKRKNVPPDLGLLLWVGCMVWKWGTVLFTLEDLKVGGLPAA